jgi:hypothetical protein
VLKVKDFENRLRACEARFGGATKIKRKKVSPLDKRTKEELAKGCMRGGDRMNGHGYAKIYAKELLRYFDRAFTLVEVGVLTGSGIALWSSIFPKSEVIGLDIDIEIFISSISNLKKRGAYRKSLPMVYEFDQLADTTEQVKALFGTRKINVVIDDGLHTNTAILNTIEGFVPRLASDFLYFVEDNASVSKEISEKFPTFSVREYKTGPKYNDVLIVIERKK